MASWILPKNERNSLSWATSVLRIVSFVHFLEESRTPYFFCDLLTLLYHIDPIWFCDLLGTPYAPVSKILPVKVTVWGKEDIWVFRVQDRNTLAGSNEVVEADSQNLRICYKACWGRIWIKSLKNQRNDIFKNLNHIFILKNVIPMIFDFFSDPAWACCVLPKCNQRSGSLWKFCGDNSSLNFYY